MKDARFASIDKALRALADPTRLRIVALLIGGEVCVCHIHETLNIPQPKASRHLAYLRKSGLVEGRKEGFWVHYRLAAMDDLVLDTLMSTVRHCLGHVDTVKRDRKRLERATGCCAPEMTTQPTLECCAAQR